jgi:hypothetical protein
MAESSGRVPIIACVRDAWLFLGNHWSAFLPAAAIATVISEIGVAAVLLAGGSPATSGGLLAIVPSVLAGLMFTAAILRKQVRDEFRAPTGLALGGDEGRLFGVAVSMTLLAIPMFLLLTVVLSMTVFRQIAATPEALEELAADPNAFAEALLQALGPGGVFAFIAVGLVIASIVFGMVALANAATIGEKKIVIFQAWSWIGGNTLRVLGAMVLTVAPVLILTSVVAQVVTSALVGMSGEAGGVMPYLLAAIFIAFLNLMLGIPIQALGGVLYKGLRPEDFVAK